VSIPVDAPSKAWVYSRSLAGAAGLSPAGGMDVSLLWVLFVVRESSLRWVDHSSRGVTPNAVCLRVVEETHRRSLGTLGLSNNEKNRAILVI
jgi:hypothetical protein